MIAGPWASRAEFEAWWRENVVEINRLSVTDPREFARVSAVIEKFNAENPQ